MNTTQPATHTPGPWHIGQSREWDDGELHEQLAVYSAEGVKTAKVETWLKHCREESEANARLIAAAPELLAALKALLPILDNDSPLARAYEDVGQLAQAALAKAEGVDHA
jgi:hypothetical protein